jgi:hypothetical protein
MHQAHSYATVDKVSTTLQGASVAFDDPGYSTYFASLGISKDAWEAQLYGDNLTNTRADLVSDYSETVKANTINRPRTLGLRFSYKFGGQ